MKRDLTIASIGDAETGIPCYIEEVSMSFALIEKLNNSPYACKIIAVLEVDQFDPQIATKVAIEDPMGAEDVSPSLCRMSKFFEAAKKNKNEDGK